MTDMSNTDEYRASVLSALGIEDDVNIRYFADYRKALLMGLSMPFSNEDLRNEEKCRLKILEAVSNTKELINDLLAGTEYTEKTASGNPASFDDGAYGLPLKSLLVNISPKQKGSGDPSPTNIREIEPWTEVKIYQSGEDTNNFMTIRVPLNREVYGGTLNVVSGELVITHAYVDMGTLTWLRATTNVFKGTFNGLKPAPNTSMPNAIADSYKALIKADFETNPTNFSFRSDNSDPYLYFRNNSYDVASDFKSAMSGKYVAYELANPTTIQLSSKQVTTLLGQNSIWASTGAVVAKYLAK